MSEVSTVEKGYLALVLHAHLPYVRHGDRDDYLEERWVYEAMLETYVPLLLVFEKLTAEQVPFRLTLAMSPPLLSMLADPLIQVRFKNHLATLMELAVKECKRTTDRPKEYRVAKMYLERFREIAAFCGKYQFNLIPAFRQLQEAGALELITCSATHAFLPFVETEEAIRAQIMTGVETHERILGVKPRGIWLPECAYTPGIDRMLKEAGIQFFFVDTHGIEHATPKPRRGVYAPLFTEHGVAAFARDIESSKQVWSAQEGYPGDADYREYYRDIGYDLDWEYIKGYVHPEGFRINTGLKYHRITGKDQPKDVYNPDWAREKAAAHAGNFMYNRERQVEHLSAHMDRKPIVVAPYDAELFGHWWYEGPMFIDYLCRKIAYDTQILRMVTPSDYLAEYPDFNDYGRLPTCSWGRNGYGEVWLNETNEWIYRHLHRAERLMVEAVMTSDASGQVLTPLQERALQQMARELMLAQSSDWAFIMDNQSMVEYAVKRTHDHLVRFYQIQEQFNQGKLDDAQLTAMEQAFPVFPDINPRYYLPKHGHKVDVSKTYIAATSVRQEPVARVLMLSWEFPPMTVGGLSKAVYDLSRHLVLQNVEVHVLTCAAWDAPEREVMEGIHVRRLPTYQPNGRSDFFDWVFQLNLAMVDELARYAEEGIHFDLIHAHDWLVSFAAIEAKQRYQYPLLSTIHAMEHGRNQGLHTPLQHRIHHYEWKLTYESWRVIACSDYMKDEMIRHFQLPADKIDVIPNGIEVPPAPTESELQAIHEIRPRFANPNEKIIFYVGRMVREKGLDLIMEAAPAILAKHPEAKFIFGGKGPMLDQLKHQAWEVGLGEKALFLGFVDDATRDSLMRLADLAIFPSLYEPFGIVALEAMSHGTPLLVADTGGLGSIVRHGENGVKMYPGDVQSLITQVNWVLEHTKEAREMADQALAEVQVRYNWHRIAKDTLVLYQEMLPALSVR
ncbi:1,4-alpha-glucan branching protein domain-containing protein [Brevibacillus dissolubilis]|uniref:1,4-alpha-glucan branching protein domain-containing protein n=1 Tax=Brevibacillus dissolubilis TaxID=1844116 RepID=UPI0021005D00|nr:1,4-alpha-glucan branching protein domain-containing protein [Brevibacillus dissolubilis]